MANPMYAYWHRLHTQMTAPELALEPAIAALGERYRAQHLFLYLHGRSSHVADFALLDRKLIIEVDGPSHDRPEQKYKDLQHMIALEALGWRVVRLSNESALTNPAVAVERALQKAQEPAPDLQEALARHLRGYPTLPVLAARSSKRAVRSRATPPSRAAKKSAPADPRRSR